MKPGTVSGDDDAYVTNEGLDGLNGDYANSSAVVPASGEKKKRKSCAGRKLMRWSPGEDQLLLLYVDYLCIKQNIPIPWDDVGKLIRPFLTAEAIKQHLTKVRQAREDAGAQVPPKLERGDRRKFMKEAEPAMSANATTSSVMARSNGRGNGSGSSNGSGIPKSDAVYVIDDIESPTSPEELLWKPTAKDKGNKAAQKKKTPNKPRTQKIVKGTEQNSNSKFKTPVKIPVSARGSKRGRKSTRKDTDRQLAGNGNGSGSDDEYNGSSPTKKPKKNLRTLTKPNYAEQLNITDDEDASDLYTRGRQQERVFSGEDDTGARRVDLNTPVKQRGRFKDAISSTEQLASFSGLLANNTNSYGIPTKSSPASSQDILNSFDLDGFKDELSPHQAVDEGYSSQSMTKAGHAFQSFQPDHGLDGIASSPPNANLIAPGLSHSHPVIPSSFHQSMPQGDVNTPSIHGMLADDLDAVTFNDHAFAYGNEEDNTPGPLDGMFVATPGAFDANLIEVDSPTAFGDAQDTNSMAYGHIHIGVDLRTLAEEELRRHAMQRTLESGYNNSFDEIVFAGGVNSHLTSFPSSQTDLVEPLYANDFGDTFDPNEYQRAEHDDDYDNILAVPGNIEDPEAYLNF